MQVIFKTLEFFEFKILYLISNNDNIKYMQISILILFKRHERTQNPVTYSFQFK